LKDMEAHLEKLRVQITECEMIRDLATEPKKTELFARLAEHFKVLAGEIEKTMTDQMPFTLLGKQRHRNFSPRRKNSRNLGTRIAASPHA
jgi:hypothetical protein